MLQMCWKNYFRQLIMKVIGKRKPLKTNYSSGVLYGLHISNDPATEEGRDIMNALGESNCTATDSFTIVLNKMMLNRKSVFAALL